MEKAIGKGGEEDEEEGQRNGHGKAGGEGWEWRVKDESREELVEDHKSQRIRGCCVQDVGEEQVQLQEEMEYQPTA
jgi:hypothetical protein